MIKYNKSFFINQGDVTQKTNDPIWPGFEHHFICKFQEGAIKTERVMLMTKKKSNRDFFSNQEDITQKLMTGSGQFLNSCKILSMSIYLQVSGRFSQN